MVKTYIDVRNEAIVQIKAAFTDTDGKCPVNIEAHPGRFDEAEVRRLAQRTPAILTSLMAIDDEKNEIEFVTWALARSQGKDKLYDAALGMVSALIPVIRGLDADYCIDAPHDIEAECLYSGSLDAINVTMWAVRWSWQLRRSIFENGEGGLLVFDLDWFEGCDSTTVVGSSEINDTINVEVDNGNSNDANS
jgi:hypothetical protein